MSNKIEEHCVKCINSARQSNKVSNIICTLLAYCGTNNGYLYFEDPATTGTKHDTGKPDMTLLDKDFLYGVAGVMTHGAEKYGRHNWNSGLKFTRLISAAMRHLIAIASGEDTDPDSGLLHVDHVSANCNMLRGMMREKPEMDDRRKEVAK